ncbi:DMT family transporter [Synergistes jonesii]|uniref:DMT family transporter n=1 Tax=Synergistes jonesii TaxID=2754 RepID=UPI00332E842A
MKSRRIAALLMLSLVAFIWGTSFVAQILGMEHIGPFTFCAARYFIASIFTIAFAAFMGMRKTDVMPNDTFAYDWRSCLVPGVICGTVLFAGTALQQMGLLFTSAGKSAFITAMYIVIVPLFGLFAGKIPSRSTLLALAASTVGLYLISVKEDFSVAPGDALTLTGAFFWALHIIVCGHFAQKYDAFKLSAIQFSAVAVLSMFFALVMETPHLNEIIISWKPLIYSGLISTCVAYTMQMATQRYVPPVQASIILISESVFAALAGFLSLGESLTAREITGCVIMLAATLTAQIQEAKA